VKCAQCKRDIRRGEEERKRVEYRMVGGEVRVFGYQMPDGPLADATGHLVKVIHSKHYWANLKDERRGGPHAGGAISAQGD
jgi:hypothetical protein